MRRAGRGFMHMCVLVALVASATIVRAQSMTIAVDAGLLHVRAPAFSFIEGDVLSHLRDGRSVRVELALTAMETAAGGLVSERKQRFNLSFDLWEERIAATRLGSPPRAVSHMTPKEAEAWCVDALGLPVTELASRGRATPFWIKLVYNVAGEDAPPESADEAFSLRTLIDLFSRRTGDHRPQQFLQAGPFRLSDIQP